MTPPDPISLNGDPRFSPSPASEPGTRPRDVAMPLARERTGSDPGDQAAPLDLEAPDPGDQAVPFAGESTGSDPGDVAIPLDHEAPDPDAGLDAPNPAGVAAAALWPCDLVMKGGITSGLVYPKAVVRMARDYRISHIGGTSIGAIAAALTAAAEFWRQSHPEDATSQQVLISALVDALPEGNSATNDDLVTAIEHEEAALIGESNPHRDSGFAALYRIPEEIGEDLVGKFQPQPETAGMFRWFLGVSEAGGLWQRLLVIVFAQFYVFRTAAAVLLALFGIMLVQHPKGALWLAIGLGLLGVGGVVLQKAMAFLRHGRAPEERVPAPAQPSPLGFLLLDRRGNLVLAAVVAILAYLMLGADGWNTVGTWIDAHPWPTVAIALVPLLLTVGDRPITRLWQRVQPSDDPLVVRERRRIVEVATALVAVAILLGLLIGFRDAIDRNRPVATVGFAGFLIGWAIGGLIGLLANLLVFLPHNHNGLCTGLGNEPDGPDRGDPDQDDQDSPSPALTNWLTGKINAVARPPTDAPLTVGDLGKHGIVFEAMTSDLSRGVPLDLPHALANYGFDTVEFRRLFPPRVVDHLMAHGSTGEALPTGLVGFADATGSVGHVPVVVVARMSMSFPVLFSTVPVTYLRTGGPVKITHALSDGGIVSNFPVHKFDHALSPHPTFAIDLIDMRGSPPATLAAQYSTSPILTKHSQDMQLLTSTTHEITGPAALLQGILSTARGWMDNSQKSLPGFQERIVGVHLYGGEGGLNLTMSKDAITRLANRGMFATHRFLGTWSPLAGVNSEWHQHRWLRYRMLMRSIENWGAEWQSIFDRETPTTHTPSLASLVHEAGLPGAPLPAPTEYRYAWLASADAELAERLTSLWDAYAETVVGQADARAAAGASPAPGHDQTFDQPQAPATEPILLMMPPFD